MFHVPTLAIAALAAGAASALAQDAGLLATAPPAAPYQAVSGLVPLPDFLPGLGQLFVDPRRCPPGRSSPTTATARWSAPST